MAACKELPSADVDFFLLNALPNRDLHRCNIVRCTSTPSTVENPALHKLDIQSLMSEFTVRPLNILLAHSDTSQQFVLHDFNHLPVHILYGLPAPLALISSTPWWTNVPLDDSDAGGTQIFVE